MKGYSGVLGLNRRELELIGPLNSRATMLEVAANKVNAKRLLVEAGIPVPMLFAVLEDRHALKAFDWNLPADFALKPAGGGRGCGILVAKRREHGVWYGFDPHPLTRDYLTRHIVEILFGEFSREGRPDLAFFEQRLASSVDLTGGAATGLPDVRVIVQDGRAVMAMTRIPTTASQGKANLHQGAVGVGIDIATGETRHAVHEGRPCTAHPDTGHVLVGRVVPDWATIVRIALASARVSRLGYSGIDIVVDDVMGPAVLEINARPGLDIQIANLTGLRSTLFRPPG